MSRLSANRLSFLSGLCLSWLLLVVPAESANPAGGETAANQSKSATWAHIEVKGDYQEGPETPGLFGATSESLAQGIERLDKAAGDASISGVVLRINSPTIGWAKLNEYRQSVGRLRDKGKKVYAWLDSGSSLDYLLATSCDEIVMPESGVLMLLGLRSEVTFYKNLLDKLAIRADMLQVGEFKAAAEPYTRTEMSAPFRQEMEAILDDYFDQMVGMVAQGRKLERDQVIAAINSGPLTTTAAHQLGLISRIAYEDQLPEILRDANAEIDVKLVKKYGQKELDTDFSGFGGMVKLMNLLMGIEPSSRRSVNPQIAVVYASGMIMSGSSSSDFLGASVLGSDTLIKAIEKANKDSNVKAIVLRVDSPGGSALASDLIWRALEKVDKPVVASMGDVAASGGYYISMGADTIFAEPGTVTGSIGVVGGKFALQGLMSKVGITTHVIQRGQNSGVLSLLEGFSDSEREAMLKLLNDIYDQFTKKAAQGRKMEHADLEKLARGRVYTGQTALKIGLVDKLGTLDDAVEHAKRLAGLKPDDKVERIILPKPVSPFEQIFGPIDPNAAARASVSAAFQEVATGLPPELTRALADSQMINLLAREPRLTLMPFRLVVK